MAGNLFDLSGKVAVVTGAGANGGIGHAIAVGFAQHGADLFVSDIDEPGATTTVAEIRQLGRRAEMAVCDISSEVQVHALFAAVDRIVWARRHPRERPLRVPQPRPPG